MTCTYLSMSGGPGAAPNTSPVYLPYGQDADHIASKSALGRTSEANGCIARWLMRLQEYELEIQHVKGSTQVVADGLSRLPHWRVPSLLSEDPFTLPSLYASELLSTDVSFSREHPSPRPRYYILQRNGLTALMR